MTQVDVDRFVELVKLSRVVDDPLLEKKRAEAPASALQSAENFAEYLIQQNLLTRWQTDNLLAGKHKGFRLGNYRLKRKLGRGGMSTVYLAQHALMKREAAIKVLPRRRVQDSSYLARFHREAQAAAALDHHNIVRIYDVDADGNVHYIAMEFIDGQDLQTRVVNDGPLDFDVTADYVAQAALGMQHAHNIGLIHRDIKPANLLANEKDIIKILDMGLAKFDEDEDSTSLTVEHDENVLGTVDYLSPEQAIDSHNVDHRADIYSLGCTFYFLLTGKPPFPEGTLAQRLMKHQKARPSRIEDLRQDVPPSLVRICNQMMRKDPDKRIQTAESVVEHLGKWLASRGKEITSDSSIGSKLGLAAANVRDMTIGLKTDPDDRPLEDDPIATLAPETETERDTTISRSQDETRKSGPSLMPDELDLAPTPEEAKQPKQPTKSDGATGESVKPVVVQDISDVDLESLAKELEPLEMGEDPLMGSKLNGGTRLAPKESESEGLPIWVWPVCGVVGVVVIGLLLLIIF